MNRRRFPQPGWAWPTRGRDLLLKAALLPDADAALDHFGRWLAAQDLNDAVFADHRLLAAIAERHGAALEMFNEYPRLKGMQRKLWTESRLRVHANLPLLRALSQGGVPVMLFKGAARVAVNPAAQRQRAHQDVDILVRDEHMAAAARILVEQGWQTARGETPLSALARAPTARAINFHDVRDGDIDLHRSIYHGTNFHPRRDAAIWEEAVPANFFGQPVLVPRAEERLSITLAHGAWSSHSHSDWLIDAAELIAQPELNWSEVGAIVRDRSMVFQARIGLGYLGDEIGLPLPTGLLEDLAALPQRGTLARSGALLLARPEDNLGRLGRIARQVWMRLEQRRQRTSRVAAPPLVLAFARPSRLVQPIQHSRLVATLPSPGTGSHHLSLDLTFTAPAAQRRIELELNSPTTHIARFRIFSRARVPTEMRVRLSVKFTLAGEDPQLFLSSCPGGIVHGGDSPKRQQKYCAVPIRLLRATFD